MSGGRGTAVTALAAFVRKELRHLARDRQTLVILVLMPLVQVLLFGFALRTDIRTVRVLVVDPAPDAATLRVRGALEGNWRFRIAGVAPTVAAVEPAFRRGTADVAVVFPPDLMGRLPRAGGAADARDAVQVITDASNPATGTTMQGHVVNVLEAALAGPAAGAHAAVPRIDVATRMQYNPTLASANLFVPGLMALVLSIVATLMTAISLSREKERGAMELLLVSPLRPWQVIVGKVLPYLALGAVIAALVIVAARVVFAVPVRGSLWLLALECLLFLVFSLAFGTVIAARAASQRAALMVALVATLLPTVLLSGMIFPVASLPLPLRTLSAVVPARWFIAAVRAIMLKGTGLAVLWQETLVLAAMAGAFLLLGARSVRARLA